MYIITMIILIPLLIFIVVNIQELKKKVKYLQKEIRNLKNLKNITNDTTEKIITATNNNVASTEFMQQDVSYENNIQTEHYNQLIEQTPSVDETVYHKEEATTQNNHPRTATTDDNNAKNANSIIQHNKSLKIPPIITTTWQYLISGNLLAKVGVVILFFASAFLLKYAVQAGYFPVWLRFLLTACLGLSLASIGYFIRHKNDLFAKIISGGGIGITYITIYASFQFTHLLPNSFALFLLLIVIALSIAGSLMLNSFALATMSTLGGLMAPILIYPDGNFIALFSYYFALNIGVLLMSTRRNWYYLNVLCFMFTYGASALWHIHYYHQTQISIVEFALNLLLALYIVMALVIATQQNAAQNRSASTIIFGAPLINLLMQTSLLSISHHALAILCLIYSITYAVLFILLRNKLNLRLLADSFSILALTFLSLVFVISLDSYNTALIWAIEGCAVLWAGLRQKRKSTIIIGTALSFLTYFCLLTHALAIDQFVFGWLHEYQQPISTNAFLATVIYCSIVSLISYFQLQRQPKLEIIAKMLLRINIITWNLAGYAIANTLNLNTEKNIIMFEILFNIIFAQFIFITVYNKIKNISVAKQTSITTTLIAPLCLLLIQAYILQDHNYIISGICFLYAISYAALNFKLKKILSTKLLAQAFFILGSSCLSLSFLYYFNPYNTTLVWSLEAALIIWYAKKEEMPYAIMMGVILQMLAFLNLLFNALEYDAFNTFNHIELAFGFKKIYGTEYIHNTTKYIIVTAYGCSILGLISCSQLVVTKIKNHARYILLFTSLLCWFSVGKYADSLLYGTLDLTLLSHMMLYATFTFLALWAIGEWRKYKDLNYVALLTLPCLILYCILFQTTNKYWSTVTWIVAMISWLLILYRADKIKILANYSGTIHLATTFLLIIYPIQSVILITMPNQNLWAFTTYAIWSLVIINILRFTSLKNIWPTSSHIMIYQMFIKYISLFNIISVIGINLFIFNLQTYLYTIPFLDQITIAAITITTYSFYTARSSKNKLLLELSALSVLINISFLLIRLVHYYLHVPYDFYSIINSQTLETLLSVVWTLAALFLMLLATKIMQRRYWFCGAGLLTIEILKLFFLDMQKSNTLERIIAFIIVGGLTLVISYFSPLPPQTDRTNNLVEE